MSLLVLVLLFEFQNIFLLKHSFQIDFAEPPIKALSDFENDVFLNIPKIVMLIPLTA